MRRKIIIASVFCCIGLGACKMQPTLKDFTTGSGNDVSANTVSGVFRFNGFTEHWQSMYQNRVRYGNLFRLNLPDVEASILQSKINIAEDLGLPGLHMQEGFLNGLLSNAFVALNNPTREDLENAVKTNQNVLAFLNAGAESAKELLAKAKDSVYALPAYQYNSQDFVKISAFVLRSGEHSLYTVVSSDEGALEKFKTLWTNTENLLKEYDLHKGWFGAQTLLKSVTCSPGTPIELMGIGMNEGCSWFVFDGYMEFLAKKEIENWVTEAGLPVVTDVGFAPIYGLENYDGLQVQSMFTPESWIDYAHKKKGYVFRSVYDTTAEKLKLPYDGYVAIEGNLDQINAGNKPFIASTGFLKDGVTTSMVLFNKKGEDFTQKALWKAIMNGREVAVLEQGKMMGPALYRNALQLLLLDRLFLENYFGDRLNIETNTTGSELQVTVSNSHPYPVKGSLKLSLPEHLKYGSDSVVAINLAANSTLQVMFDLIASPEAMGRPNAVGVQLDWGSSHKTTAALVDLPPAITAHELLYGNAAGIAFPVSVYNFTGKANFPVKLTVADKNDSSKIAFIQEVPVSVAQASAKTVDFDIKVPAGAYTVTIDAMGLKKQTQLGVESGADVASLKEVDLDKDGINEYNLENDHVQVTLLTAGARVIEYIVKSKKDNILFKLWPEKPVDDRRPFRNREFYPYGGFEDFLGQPSIETHKVYSAEVVKAEGEYVQVKMKADYFGNTIEKIFTLYGNSPLLEIRFALNMKNAELSMLGPQPILEIGKAHGPEDAFIIPEMDGLHEYRMKPEKSFGRAFFVKEGWNAGYDTREDISFAGAFPVNQPIFLHMWMNHPSNPGSHYYYSEFQPWTPLSINTTTYFSYYIWAAAGGWQQSVKALRDRNLISERTVKYNY
ncbi:MAG: hypothetical protein KIT80_05150 [Chitinophagaceae bacterium]|nr:hypothetical protein [Chitinophagaceae bacterium]MCW5926281.1 hypothetical protein [Chitinophagaceae bacterium]